MEIADGRGGGGSAGGLLGWDGQKKAKSVSGGGLIQAAALGESDSSGLVSSRDVLYARVFKPELNRF